MKEVYLLRHAEKASSDGALTKQGEAAAAAMAAKLPHFAKVISSPSSRASLTAKLVAGEKPIIDDRANFAMAPPEKSDAINALAAERHSTFLEAAQEYADSEVMAGISKKADELNELIDELLAGLSNGEAALVASHDLSISPAMAKRGVPLASIDFLRGYVINDLGEVRRF